MNPVADIYPKAPVGVPDDFTKPSKSYGRRVNFLLLGLLGFLLLYMGLVILTAWGLYFFITHSPDTWLEPQTRRGGRGNTGIWGLWAGGILAMGILFIFFFKGLFKRQKTDWSHFLELKPQDQPRLFAFIDRLCQETQAPKPHKVYLSHDVNAAVMYNTSLLNLFIAPKKNLLIGAGLVEAINLREFQAVLAHEFGHFSQKSLAFGNYVYLVNKILGDMIYGRDAFDRFLLNWSGWDIRISFPAWGLRGVIWGLRLGLGGVYKGINLLNLSLSRQMEFNADDVAVSVAGSDAIVDSLCKTHFADECQNAAAEMLITAADHSLFTKDFYHHQSRMAPHIRMVTATETRGVPKKPSEPGQSGKDVRVFDPTEGVQGIPKMWLSHPPNHEREANAKRLYFPAGTDERSAWYILDNCENLREQMSRIFYRLALGKEPTGELADAILVQDFIAKEISERTYDPKYGIIYDNRWVGLEKLAEWEVDKEAIDSEKVHEYLTKHPAESLKKLVAKWVQLRAEADLFEGLVSKRYKPKGKTVEFRGEQRNTKDSKKILDQIETEFNEVVEKLAETDREVFLIHHHAAAGTSWLDDLENRYRFHAKLQEWFKKLNGQKGSLESMLQAIQGAEQIPEADFKHLKDILNEAREAILEVREATFSVICPPLANLNPETSLQSLVFDEVLDLGEPLDKKSGIDGPWIGNLYTALEKTNTRLRRVHFKSLGGILSLQEGIAKNWLTTHVKPPDLNPETTPPLGAS